MVNACLVTSNTWLMIDQCMSSISNNTLLAQVLGRKKSLTMTNKPLCYCLFSTSWVSVCTIDSASVKLSSHMKDTGIGTGTLTGARFDIGLVLAWTCPGLCLSCISTGLVLEKG